jgi:hypothetical protein
MAKAIAEWIVHNGIKDSRARQIKREGGIPGITSRTSCTSTEKIEDALGYLVALRWLKAEEVTTKRGGRPTIKYFVNEQLWPLVRK